MTSKQLRMLKLLDSQINQCKACSLWQNSRAKPYWTESSKYAIIGEAPGYNEVRLNEPFVGTAGEILWDIMDDKGFSKEEFLVINSVNCRPVDEWKEWKNGKPTEEEQLTCKPWIRKYLKVMKPEGVLILGNYAMFTVTENNTGIISLNATVLTGVEPKHDFRFNIPYVLSIHPAYCIYNKNEGRVMLAESISAFKKAIEDNKPIAPTKEFYDFLEDEELWKI